MDTKKHNGWTNAFLEDVNWQEIADHMNQEYAMC